MVSMRSRSARSWAIRKAIPCQEGNVAEQPEDDWASAMAEQQGANPATDDWGAAMAEQAAAPKVTPAAFENLTSSGTHKIAIRSLLQLAQGSVVELDGLAGEPMDVLVNGCLNAQGEVVVVNDKFGIRLTDVITPSERIRKLN